MKNPEEAPPETSPTRPVTMAMIAREAGLSRSAVSYALSNHPSISEATRRRVQEVAARMGYRRNAYVSALMAQVKRQKVDGTGPVIGWLSDSAITAQAMRQPFFRNIREGAQARAAQLGFSLEPFAWNDGRVNLARLGGVLQARGIQGLIIGPVTDSFSTVAGRFPFNAFATSAIGYSLREPDLYRVGIDYSSGMRLLWKRIVAAGFKRPGLLISASYDERTNYNIRGTYVALQASTDTVEPITPCFAEGVEEGPIREWLSAQRPDAVICATYADVVEAVEGFSPPGTAPERFWLNHGGTLPVAGIRQPDRELGAAAVDVVVGQLHRNDTGIPETPTTVLIPYRWVDKGA